MLTKERKESVALGEEAEDRWAWNSGGDGPLGWTMRFRASSLGPSRCSTRKRSQGAWLGVRGSKGLLFIMVILRG